MLVPNLANYKAAYNRRPSTTRTSNLKAMFVDYGIRGAAQL
jgi:hypothetical protein